MKNSFLDGSQEGISRIVSMILSTSFFAIYTLASDSGNGLNITWVNTIISLVIFWVVYESLSFGLYLIFIYFSKQNNQPNSDFKDTETSKINQE